MNAPWLGWVFNGSGDLPDAGWQSPSGGEPAGSDRLPVHRSESSAGYCLTGCSPAEPASAHRSPTIVADPARASNALAQPHCKDNVHAPVVFAAAWGGISTLHARVTFLSCADNVAPDGRRPNRFSRHLNLRCRRELGDDLRRGRPHGQFANLGLAANHDRRWVSPGLAVLSAAAISQFLCRMLEPPPDVAPQPRV